MRLSTHSNAAASSGIFANACSMRGLRQPVEDNARSNPESAAPASAAFFHYRWN